MFADLHHTMYSILKFAPTLNLGICTGIPGKQQKACKRLQYQVLIINENTRLRGWMWINHSLMMVPTPLSSLTMLLAINHSAPVDYFVCGSTNMTLLGICVLGNALEISNGVCLLPEKWVELDFAYSKRM